MKLIGSLLLVIVTMLVGFPDTGLADDACGEAPPLANQQLKGAIDGGMKGLSQALIGGNLKGEIEYQKSEVLSKYPNADRLIGNIYMLHMGCVTIMNHKGLSADEKMKFFKDLREEIFPSPVKKSTLLIEDNGLFIDNTKIGDVYASTSKIEFYVDGDYEDEMHLSEPFPSIKLDVEHGNHTFTYKVDIRAKSSLKVRDSCVVKFSVEGDTVFSPYIAFKPYDGARGIISSCRLRAL